MTRQNTAEPEKRRASHTVSERQPRERRRRHCGHRITTRLTSCTTTVEGVDKAKGIHDVSERRQARKRAGACVTNRLTSCTTTRRKGDQRASEHGAHEVRSDSLARNKCHRPVKISTHIHSPLAACMLVWEESGHISAVQCSRGKEGAGVAFSFMHGLGCKLHVPAADKNTGRLLRILASKQDGIAHFDWDSRIARDVCTVNTHPAKPAWSSRSSMRLHT
jgi:hypothetical protein